MLGYHWAEQPCGAVDQDDRRTGLTGGVRGAVPVDVCGAEACLHVRLEAGGLAHCVKDVAGGEVAVAERVVDVVADVASRAASGRVLGHGGTSGEIRSS